MAIAFEKNVTSKTNKEKAMKTLLASILLVATLAVGFAGTANAGGCAQATWQDNALDDNRT